MCGSYFLPFRATRRGSERGRRLRAVHEYGDVTQTNCPLRCQPAFGGTIGAGTHSPTLRGSHVGGCTPLVRRMRNASELRALPEQAMGAAVDRSADLCLDAVRRDLGRREASRQLGGRYAASDPCFLDLPRTHLGTPSWLPNSRHATRSHLPRSTSTLLGASRARNEFDRGRSSSSLTSPSGSRRERIAAGHPAGRP